MKKILSIIIIITSFNFADNILPAQTDAIKALATENGFSNESLEKYLIQNYGTTIYGLSRNQGIQIINLFQSENPPKPLMQSFIKEEVNNEDLLIAESLEVGMSKRFYMVDGNVIDGSITSIDDGICSINTVDGNLKIPVNEILEESVSLLKKDGSRYKGPVIKEDLERIVIKSKYGEVNIHKKEIKSLDRFQGGRLVPKTEVTKEFYQGEAQLINVFLDPNAFPLEPNAFYASALSVGYGLTDRFMLTTKFADNFNGDLNISPKWRIYHEKEANTEKAFSIGATLHSQYPLSSIISKYPDRVKVIDSNSDSTICRFNINGSHADQNEQFCGEDERNNANYRELFEQDTSPYFEFFGVYSSRRKNPTGRGNVGWSVGLKTSTAFIRVNELSNKENGNFKYIWDAKSYDIIPFRAWASLEYDLRKKIKFVGSMWLDNGYVNQKFSDSYNDFFNDNDGGNNFIFDNGSGEPTLFDFDFGILYAINNNFRLGIHFKKPYLDIYWKFYEF